MAEYAIPYRLNYFHGQLLTRRDFETEQRYHIDMRRLLNRHTVGSGVLYGADALEVTPTNDGNVQIQPGIAIDRLGREIVVPEARLIDPRALTDDCGCGAGETLRDAGAVIVCLAYHECPMESALRGISNCGVEPECVHGKISERYKVLVRQTANEAGLPGKSPVGVPLAEIEMGEDGPELITDLRKFLYSNGELFARYGASSSQPKPPTVTKIWPESAAQITEQVMEDLFEAYGVDGAVYLFLAFDREMDGKSLAEPSNWLRIWKIESVEGINKLSRIELNSDDYGEVQDIYGRIEEKLPGYDVGYRLSDSDSIPASGTRYLVQMRPPDESITDLSPAPMLLDADFSGTYMTDRLFDQIWDEDIDEDDKEQLSDVLEALTKKVAWLPSGDGKEGGRFHSWFTVAL